jgi:hypothetical protein
LARQHIFTLLLMRNTAMMRLMHCEQYMQKTLRRIA